VRPSRRELFRKGERPQVVRLVMKGMGIVVLGVVERFGWGKVERAQEVLLASGDGIWSGELEENRHPDLILPFELYVVLWLLKSSFGAKIKSSSALKS
jgi:hypothetical protein